MIRLKLNDMKDLKDQLIEKQKEYIAYLRTSFWSSYKIAIYECEIDELEKQIKEQEAQEKVLEVTDEMIEKAAEDYAGREDSSRKQFIDAEAYDGYVEGAKAMRDGKIK